MPNIPFLSRKARSATATETRGARRRRRLRWLTVPVVTAIGWTAGRMRGAVRPRYFGSAPSVTPDPVSTGETERTAT